MPSDWRAGWLPHSSARPGGGGAICARWPGDFNCPTARQEAGGPELAALRGPGPEGDPLGSPTLSDCILREPSPSTNSPGGGDDPTSGPVGKNLGGRGRPPASLGGACIPFPFGGGWAVEASVAQSDSYAKCKDDFCGEGSVPPPPPAPSPSAGTTGTSQV